ncbi:phospholipase D family protein [Orbaceae bacterium ESL0721]|nr:phospholipase D family protein [Orbaceae bacterium ESL0721]
MTTFFIIIGTFIFASLISLYSYGRFSRRAKGAPSYSLPIQPDHTILDRSFNQIQLTHPDQSGLMLIPSDLDAFAIRQLTARNAGRSLDLQYYIWHDDLTGRLLGVEILKAADHGVRVRILLDDMNTHNSHILAVLNLHPNIEIRLFNPTRSRSKSIMRGIEMLLRFFSVNRRMHNKLWIVDGRLTVVGGRNIGNEYFGAADDRNFFDIDLAITGHAVAEASSIFDTFWNSNAVIPIKALMFVKDDALNALRRQIDQKQSTGAAATYLQRISQSSTLLSLFEEGGIFNNSCSDQSRISQSINNFSTNNNSTNNHSTNNNSLNDHSNGDQHNERLTCPLYWSNNVHIISDPPEKAYRKRRDEWLLKKLLPILGQSRKTLRIISPYFVPGKIGVSKFTNLRQLGVDVEILTNSLVTNDVLMAHGGYAPYRIPLLKAGVKIYELRPFGKTEKKLIGSSGASLHTKAFLVDSKIGFVGSFNFDPRSANLNSEMGILFEDPDIMRALQREFELRSSQDFSYQLSLKPNNGSKKAKIYWQGLDCQNHFKVWSYDPESKWWQRILTKIIAKLPIESQL